MKTMLVEKPIFFISQQTAKQFILDIFQRVYMVRLVTHMLVQAYHFNNVVCGV